MDRAERLQARQHYECMAPDSCGRRQGTGYVRHLGIPWKAGDTLDGVAYKFYEETEFRWAILDANTKYRTEFDIKVGDVILIPSFEEVVDLVNV